MLSLRNRFGIPGVISVIALVFAMFGGAYAASNNSGGGKAAASAKAKAGPRGPRGKTGPAGPAGPTGPAGSQGSAGANGKDGASGTNGAPGAPGKDGESVTVTESAAAIEGHCNGTTSGGLGGSKFVVGAGKTYACNGKEGSPWTVGGFLPSKKTETGTWAASFPGETEGIVFTPISLPLPLEQKPTLVFVSLVNDIFGTPLPEVPGEEELKAVLEEGAEHGCPGLDAGGVPLAEPGVLCVYGNSYSQLAPSGTPVAPTHSSTENENGTQIFLNGGSRPKETISGKEKGAGPAGTQLQFLCSEGCRGMGVWAVTAE